MSVLLFSHNILTFFFKDTVSHKYLLLQLVNSMACLGPTVKVYLTIKWCQNGAKTLAYPVLAGGFVFCNSADTIK